MTNLLYSYWGKTDKENNYHLLAYHSLDVAAVAAAYFNEHPEMLHAMSLGLGLKESEARSLILLLIVLHDLGKFGITFQSKNRDVFKLLNPNRNARDNIPFHHDVLGNAIWRKNIYARFKDIILNPSYLDSQDIMMAFNVLIEACVGHHGKPTNVGDNESSMLKAFDEEDKEAAYAFLQECKNIFFSGQQKINLVTHTDEDQLKNCFKRVSWWLSGLTILADWLGSNRAYFPYETKQIELSDYWNSIQKNAKLAIAENGLNKISIAPEKNYATLFNLPFPRPLQSYAECVVLRQEPQLFILEDMTGAGKTEAALMLAYRIMALGAADGMYFALPTMATANGIYHRLTDPKTGIYKNFFTVPENVSIILAHANNYLAKPYHSSIVENENPDKTLKDELSSATAYCNAWFSDNRKKALLANMGIGTIDQALQSILPNRHQSLRLIGLFRKVLIVDEVHACDTYMLELLANLIVFHTASGGSTILLSATLPQNMRNSLTHAFYQALMEKPFQMPAVTDHRYPLATHCQMSDEPVITPIEAVPELCRMINATLCDSLDEVEKTILKHLNAGLCVCWIRNTVTDATKSYKKFTNIYSKDKITLFHSRFTMNDRYKIENKVMSMFGKKSSKESRQGQLLIATQVVEQSLDLDFDFMVSDLAPIDLLIQRIGRLQRHIRNELRLKAMILIYGPQPALDAKEDWYSALLPKAARVYDDHAQLWLTAKLIVENPIIRIPEHVREFVEYVYHEDNIAQCPEALQKINFKSDGKARGNQEMAKNVKLKIDTGYQNESGMDWWDDMHVPTRLNEQKTIKIYLAVWDGQDITPWHQEKEFSWEMSSLTVAEYFFAKEELCKNPTLMNSLPPEVEKLKMQNVLIHDSQDKDWFYLIKKDEAWQLSKLKNILYDECNGFRQEKSP